jgi:hypothetical protein
MSPIGDWLAEAQHADFTGRQAELDLFRVLLPLDRQKALSELGDDARQRVQSLSPPKRLQSLVVLGIHGIGGIGKSRLLAQFQALTEEYDTESDRLKRDEPVLVARLDLQSHKGILDFLIAIYEQLEPRMEFPNFEAGLKQRQEIEDRLRKSDNIHKGTLQTLSLGVSSLIKGVPFVGELIGETLASPAQIEAAISGIYRAVGRKEGDFWMKPEDELTNRLLADLEPISEKYRFVLMFDTYELIGIFDEWVRERFLPRLGKHTLMVVAGRHSLEERGWQRYSSLMWQFEVPPFSHNESREYLEKKGVTDTQVVTSLADRTDGHPLTLSMFAELVAQGEVIGTDLMRSAESKKVIQQLLKSIRERIPESLQMALEICAVLRVMNEDSLAYMLDQDDVGLIFDQVRAFDFVKMSPNGIVLHDTVGSAINDELLWRSPNYYHNLHNKASQFYGEMLTRGSITEHYNYELERLYHRIRANENEGMNLFKEMANGFVLYGQPDQLRRLLVDVYSYKEYLVVEDNRKVLDNYDAKLLELEHLIEEVDRVRQSPRLRHAIESKFPYPIAHVFYQLRSTNGWLAEVPQLENVLGVTLEHFAILAMSEYFSSMARDKTLNTKLLNYFDRSMTQGRWAALLRDVLTYLHTHNHKPFISPLFDFYFPKQGEQTITTLREMWDQLVHARNELVHPNSYSPPSKDKHHDFKQHLIELLQTAAFLTDYPLISALSTHTPGGVKLRMHTCLLYMGYYDKPDVAQLYCDVDLDENRVVLLNLETTEVLDLYPLYLLDACSESSCRQLHLLRFNTLEKKGAMYLSVEGHSRLDAVAAADLLEILDGDLWASKLRRKAQYLSLEPNETWRQLPEGYRIADKYEVVGHIRHGGMADVYKVRQLYLSVNEQQYFALKLLPFQFLSDRVTISRFRSEAIQARRLNHPNIVRTIEYGEELVDHYLVMEIAQGWKINGGIALDVGELPKPLNRDILLHILKQACEGLHYIHGHQMVHGDVKPGNLLLFDNNVVKLSDFGITRSQGMSRLTMTGPPIGTPEYMSPEQAQGMELTAESDIYSLGVVLYELLEGNPPFRRTTPLATYHAHLYDPVPVMTSIKPDSSDSLQGIVMRCLEKAPEKRFKSAKELYEAVVAG